MKKRNFVAILMVAIGLFVSVNLFASDEASASGDKGHDITTSSGDVCGVYVPD
jgi:ABC-type multidrug transport system permease subunit